MIDWTHVTSERRSVASPIWIALRDAFTGRPPTGPLTVRLERRTGTAWTPFEYRHQVSTGGDLAFVNLGRSNDPGAIGSFEVRVTVGCPGMIAEAVTTTVTAWAPDAPAAPSQPDVLQLFPGPGYAYPAGTPLLTGRVVDTDGAPVARARVFSTTTVQGTPLTEEVRTAADGYFRLPLRWSTGATAVHAALGGRTAAITVFVPADLSTTQQITLT
jgi:hypothetical protein